MSVISRAKCPERSMLEAAMMAAKEEELLSYAELARASKLTVKELQRTKRFILSGAVKALEQEGYFFLCEANEGMRRVTEKQYLDTAVPDRVDRTRRLNRRNAQALKAMDYEALDREARIRWNKQATLAAVLEGVTSKRQQALIGAACEQADRALEAKRTVIAMLSQT